jgi:hypothetical protein
VVARRQEPPLRPDRELDWLKLLGPIEAPLRHAVVALQRGQTRSPAQALSNTPLQLRHKRGSRTIDSLLGLVWYSGFATTRKPPFVMGGLSIGGKKVFVMVASPFPE